MARQSGDTWFIGIMNNGKRRTIEIELDFLADGDYAMELWKDTKKSDQEPTRLQKKIQNVEGGDIIKIDLAVNGGFVAVIKKSPINIK